MGFLKWLYSQYKNYKYEKDIKKLEPSQEEKQCIFNANYEHCLKLGFSDEQLRALMNLFLN